MTDRRSAAAASIIIPNIGAPWGTVVSPAAFTFNTHTRSSNVLDTKIY